MTEHDRLDRYLADQARTITLPPSDVAEVTGRGRRRRARRRSALVGSVAVVGVIAGSVAFRDTSDTPVESGFASATVTPSELDWTVVTPQVGLGYGRSTAVVGGALYSLSSAPGPYVDGHSFAGTHLYRSTDGAEWAEVEGPDGVAASSLAAQGDTLYAVGTAPAGGGGRDLVVAASHDGARSWSLVTLPAEIAALEARFPGQVVLSQPSIASVDGQNVVASVTVSANPDLSALPELQGDEAYYDTDADGVIVYAVPSCGPEVDPAAGCADQPSTSTTMVRTAGEPGEEGVVDAEVALEREAARADAEAEAEAVGSVDLGVERDVEPIAHYTWAELGVDPDLQALVGGRVFVYVSDDGQAFERIDLPADVRGSGGSLVATDDGYRLFASSHDGVGTGSTKVLSSSDGRAWSVAATIPGSVSETGSLAGRPGAVVYMAARHFEGPAVYVEQPGGSWQPFDLSAPLGDDAWIWNVAFGPLGVIGYGGVPGDGSITIVHSDGDTVSAVDIGDLVDMDRKTPVGIEVTADAFLLRLGEATDDDVNTPPAQEVLVGTPR